LASSNLDGVEVGGDVIADSGVRTSAGLYCGDAVVGENGHAPKCLGVFGGEDAPVLVQLETTGAAEHLFVQTLVRDGVALAEQHHVHRHRVHRLVHERQVPRTFGHRGCLGRRQGRHR
jgi:hypothetical protein